MSKLDKVKKILAASDSQARALREVSLAKDESYKDKLKHEIQQTKTFLNQADHAIESLTPVEKRFSDSEKVRVVALFDAYGKLPFIPDKDEVVGTATASIKVGSLVRQHHKMISHLKNSALDIDNIEFCNQDFRAILEQTAEVNRHGAAKLRDLDTRIHQVHTEGIRLVDDSLDSLNAKITESKKLAAQVSSYLKRVLTKFLALQNWEDPSSMDSNSLKLAIKSLMVTLDKLLTAPPQAWVEITPTDISRLLIKTLVMVNVVDTRPDSSQDTFYLRIKPFGMV